MMLDRKRRGAGDVIVRMLISPSSAKLKMEIIILFRHKSFQVRVKTADGFNQQNAVGTSGVFCHKFGEVGRGT